MRQAFVQGLTFFVRRSSLRFRSAIPKWFLAFATITSVLAVAAVLHAEPSRFDTPTSRIRSRAKRVGIFPRATVSERQAKNFIGIGPILGFTSHVESPTTTMLGLELSYVRYPYAAFEFGMGGFVQGQTVGFDHARFAFGPQFNFMMFGAEIGAFLEEGSGPRATTVGVHASPFVSLGFFSAALRIAVPLGTLTPGDPYGIDLGLVCAIKLPISLDGQLFSLAFH